ncbi:hypothetical protein AGMMS49992_11830 [Clostridia bacterium]|nr:hypothetical protein AGMMS49992_11830 [Clostridia bacterium]
MTAKDYLGKIRLLEARVEAKISLIQSLRATLKNTCSHISETPHSASPDLQPTQTLHARICDIEHEANEAVDALVDYQRDISGKIELLSKQVYRQVLDMRYIQKLKWNEIRDQLKYSKTGIEGIHRRALSELNEKLQA